MYFKSLPKFIFSSLVGIVLITAFSLIIVDVYQVFAAAGDVKVTVKREGDSADVQGATVEVKCTGGAYNQLTGSPTTNATGTVQAQPVAGSSCNATDAVDVKISLDGYVKKEATSTATYATSTDPGASSTVTSLQFAYKVTAITTEALASDTAASVTAFTYGDDTAENTCVLSGGAWYCPVVLANSNGTMTTTVTLNGYVQKAYAPATTTARATDTAAQVSTTITGFQYGHTLTITSAAAHGGATVTGATVTNNLGGSAEIYNENGSTGVYYGAIPIANDNATVTISKAGWTTNTGTISGNRATATSTQQAQTNATLVYNAITTLAASSSGATNSVNLSWTSSVDTASFDAYEIYYRTSSGVTNSNGTLFGKTNNASLDTRTTSSVSLTGLTCGVQFYFVIYGLDLQGNRTAISSEANTLSSCNSGAGSGDTIPPGQAKNFMASDAKTGGTINLSWVNPSDTDFGKVVIHRSQAGADFIPTHLTRIAIIPGLPNETKTYQDQGLVNGVLYFYKLFTEDTSSNSQDSVSVPRASATPTASLPVAPAPETPPVENPPVEESPSQQPQQPADMADGDLITTRDNSDIYIVKMVGTKKFKRLILNVTVFNSYGHLKWENVKTVSQEVMNSYTLSELVMEMNDDGSVASPKVYKVSSEPNSDAGTKQWLNLSPGEFEAAGYDWDAVYGINHREASPDFYPEGTSITVTN